MSKPVDSIIFDLDGTLWDASASTARAWSRVAAEHGIDILIDANTTCGVSGLPFDQCVEKIFGQHGIQNFAEKLDESEKMEIKASGGKLYDDVEMTLQALLKKYKIFLVSNCQDWYLKAFLKHSGFSTLFLDTLCFGETQLPKSKNIETIVQRHQLSRAVYVGDTHWDQDAAKAAGVEFVFAKFGFGQIKSPCPVILQLSELPALLEKI